MSNRGQVFKRGSSWGYYFSYTHNGKRKQVKKQGYKQQRIAQQALTKALAEIDGGRLVGADKQTVEMFLNGWIASYERSQTVKPTTAHLAKATINHALIPALGAVRLIALDVKTIEKFLGDLLENGRTENKSNQPVGLSPKYVRNIFGVLHRALNDAVRWGVLPHNPATNVELPRYERSPIKPWSGEQAGTFIQYAETKKDPYYAIWRLLLVTGLRRGELVGLRWSDVDMPEGKITVSQTRVMAGNKCITTTPKSRAGSRTISIDPNTVIALAQLKNEQEYRAEQLGSWQTDLIATTDDGRPLPPTWLYLRFKSAQRGSGLPFIHLHQARHTAVTWQLSVGTPAHIVSTRTGHRKTSTTTDVYAHFMPEQDNQASLTIGYALDQAIRNAQNVGSKKEQNGSRAVAPQK